MRHRGRNGGGGMDRRVAMRCSLQHLVAHSRRRLTHEQNPLAIAYQGPRLRARRVHCISATSVAQAFAFLHSAADFKQPLITLDVIEALSAPLAADFFETSP